MTLLALGINHKTAPVALRERVTFSPETLDKALESLLAQPMVQGGVVLSTCNRTELYLSVEEQDNLQEALIRWLCNYHGLNEEDLRKSLYWHQDNDAVSHLMRVASGLDSLVLASRRSSARLKSVCRFAGGHLNVSELERMFQKSFLWLSACAPKPISAPARSLWLSPPVRWRGKSLNRSLASPCYWSARGNH